MDRSPVQNGPPLRGVPETCHSPVLQTDVKEFSGGTFLHWTQRLVRSVTAEGGGACNFPRANDIPEGREKKQENDPTPGIVLAAWGVRGPTCMGAGDKCETTSQRFVC